jgi:PAS domain S-box-containing protein
VWEVYASPQIKDLLGYLPEEVVGKTSFDFMPPDEAQRIAPVAQEKLKVGESFTHLENINVRKDGRPVVLETSGVPFFDCQENHLGYRGIDRDITEHKKIEKMTNAGMGKLFNKPASEFNGKQCFRELERRTEVCSHCPGTIAMATGRAAKAENIGIRDDGSRYEAHIYVFPTFGQDGEISV